MSGWRLYWEALIRRRRALWRLAGASVVEGVPALLSGWLLAQAVDRGFAAGAAWLGAAWLGGFTLTMIIGAYGSRAVWRLLGDIIEPLRDDLVTAVARGLLFDREAPPDGTAVVARITRHVEIIRDVTGGLLVFGRSFLVATIGAVVGLAGLSPALALITGLPLVFTLLLFGWLLQAMADRQRDTVLTEEDCARSVGEVLGGLRDITACGGQEQAIARAVRDIDAQAAASIRLARLATVRVLLVAVGGMLPLVVLLAAAPRLGLSAGELVGAVTYLTVGVQPALNALIRGMGSSVLRLVVTLRRLGEVATVDEPTRLRTVERPALGEVPELRLTGISFSYGIRARPVVNELDLTVGPGDHLAIVGPSGIGKSTVANLVCGLLRAQRGRITLDGHNIRRLDPRDLHATIGLIPQQAYVFAGSVRENLTYLMPDSEGADPRLLWAARELGAAALVKRLGGLDGVVDPGELSASERQLLALVRLYVSTAAIAVLDEATANLDPVAEAKVEQAFRERPGSLIVIAHRLSSAARADSVLLLDGRHQISGKHEELVNTVPSYAAVVRAWQGGQPALPGS
ncbi:ABC transporter ATP-binding protein [Pseudonocardiaceae bacterium YIM PH 21723]|nr:ABC transporter ATP-binding protein [Pseudonocardiaceae bacterium YIM PH 21723]